jgi:hypothetical protein
MGALAAIGEDLDARVAFNGKGEVHGPAVHDGRDGGFREDVERSIPRRRQACYRRALDGRNRRGSVMEISLIQCLMSDFVRLRRTSSRQLRVSVCSPDRSTREAR